VQFKLAQSNTIVVCLFTFTRVAKCGNYYSYLLSLGVEPSSRTLAIAAANGELQEDDKEESDADENFIEVVDDDSDDSADLGAALQALNLDDKKEHSTHTSRGPSPTLPRTPPKTPPKYSPVRYICLPAHRILSFPVTPNSAMSDHGSVTLTSASSSNATDIPGAYYNPDIIRIIPNYHGRYQNGYFIYKTPLYTVVGEETKDVWSHRGFFIEKQVNPTDWKKHSARLVGEEYLSELANRNKIDQETVKQEAILFKSPSLEAGDTNGRNSSVEKLYPCMHAREHVNKQQNNFNKQGEPRFWYYTLAIFPIGIVFDNRVFSPNDSIIESYDSMAESVECPVVKETVTYWHKMWRIAEANSGEPVDQDKSPDINEIKKARRAKAKDAITY